MRRGRSKTKAQRQHARVRGAQRYGLEGADIAAIEAMVRAGRTRIVQRRSIRVSHREVDYNDRVVLFVYDHTRKQIVTFLPEGT